MQKVYLLLRNNQQTGPFSLEEIIKLDLKPYDLVWIEGKSAGWYYPQEIKALHPHLSFVKQSPQPNAETKQQPSSAASFETVKPKNVLVIMPPASMQEEVVQKTSTSFEDDKKEAYKPFQSTYNQTEPELKTTYAKSLEQVEAEYMNWAYQKKTKKNSPVSKKGAIAACLLVTIAFAGWWAVKNFSGSTYNETGQVAVAPGQNVASPASGEEEIAADSASETNAIQTGIKASAKKGKQPKIATTVKETIVQKKDASKKVRNEIVFNGNTTAGSDDEIVKQDKEETKIAADEKEPEPVAEAPKEKKKKLGEKFLDLFKKKPEEQKNEEAKPVENEGGERRSARRETNLATQVTVKFEVSNDWMIGVKGAKASLTNRSTESIIKATVEVQYYNEDNELLQTKTITFSNIGAKKTATISIPDHSFADHLDYKIISVQGAAEPFARM